METALPTSCEVYCTDVVDWCYIESVPGGVCKGEAYAYVNCYLANGITGCPDCVAPANSYMTDVTSAVKKNLRA